MDLDLRLTPCDGTPGDGKEENVEADEGDENLVGNSGENGNTDNGNDEFANTHSDGSQEKQAATTHLLNEVKTGQSGGDVDQIGDETDDERIPDTRVLEELSTVVEDEVDTGQLLESLETTSGQEPLPHLRGETIGIGRFSERHLILVDSLNLVEFREEGRVVDRKRAETAHGLCGALEIILLDEEARSLREDVHAHGKDKGPDELDGEWDTVRAGVVAVVGTLIGAGSQKETNGNSQLVTSDDRSSDPFWCRLRLVQGH